MRSTAPIQMKCRTTRNGRLRRRYIVNGLRTTEKTLFVIHPVWLVHGGNNSAEFQISESQLSLDLLLIDVSIIWYFLGMKSC